MVSEYKKSAFWKTQNQMVGWGSLGRSSLLARALKTHSLPVRSGNSISKCLAQRVHDLWPCPGSALTPRVCELYLPGPWLTGWLTSPESKT